MKRTLILIFLLFLIKSTGMAQDFIGSDGRLKVLVVKNNYEGPKTIYNGGLKDILEKHGALVQASTVELTEAEENEYGEWNRAAIESRSIGNLISVNEQNDFFTLGLLKNCSDLIGMLAGLQNMSPDLNAKDSRNLQSTGLAGKKPLKIGLVWIDAHADFNTPETSLSGMHGGMPVAIAAGMCLSRLRLKSGLDPALPTKYITMACLRDVDPLEQDLLDRSQCEFISVNDVRNLTDNLADQVERLADLTDLVYVHIDMDVLDPAEVSGHPLTAPEGPTSIQLARALEIMFSNDKCNALGIASMPYGKNDPEGLSLQATYNLIEGALKGISKR